MALIECVPNVSEGRRPDVVNAIAEAVSRVDAVQLLDRSSDEAHNRSVLTVAGPAPAVQQAVMALFAAALDLIDLREHTGGHPRLGAVDVVPFIPLAGATMAQCVALATATASMVATRFQLPVYLYEEAAATAGRRNLADIRRGEFEGLSAKMASSEWTPDYGPSRPHPTAGATVIGARAPLIAFNVNLAIRSSRRRQGRRRGGQTQQRGPAIRESARHRASPSRHRAGLNEPDELRAHLNRPCVRGGAERGRATRDHGS